MFKLSNECSEKAKTGKLINRGKFFAVVDKSTGAVISCHHTKAQAKATKTRKSCVRLTRNLCNTPFL